MKKILFVCSGDTCRSAMASAIFKDKVKKLGLKNLLCSSAGLFVTNEINMNDSAKKALKTLGVKIPRHKATQLTEELIKSSGLILTMTDDQKQTILNRFPHFRHIESLRSFVGADNISDPYGKGDAVYYNVARYLEIVVDKVIEKLEKRGEN